MAEPLRSSSSADVEEHNSRATDKPAQHNGTLRVVKGNSTPQPIRRRKEPAACNRLNARSLSDNRPDAQDVVDHVADRTLSGGQEQNKSKIRAGFNDSVKPVNISSTLATALYEQLAQRDAEILSLREALVATLPNQNALAKVPWAKLYHASGILFMNFTTPLAGVVSRQARIAKIGEHVGNINERQEHFRGSVTLFKQRIEIHPVASKTKSGVRTVQPSLWISLMDVQLVVRPEQICAESVTVVHSAKGSDLTSQECLTMIFPSASQAEVLANLLLDGCTRVWKEANGPEGQEMPWGTMPGTPPSMRSQSFTARTSSPIPSEKLLKHPMAGNQKFNSTSSPGGRRSPLSSPLRGRDLVVKNSSDSAFCSPPSSPATARRNAPLQANSRQAESPLPARRSVSVTNIGSNSPSNSPKLSRAAKTNETVNVQLPNSSDAWSLSKTMVKKLNSDDAEGITLGAPRNSRTQSAGSQAALTSSPKPMNSSPVISRAQSIGSPSMGSPKREKRQSLASLLRSRGSSQRTSSDINQSFSDQMISPTRSSVSSMILKRRAVFGRSSGCLIGGRYLGDIPLTKFQRTQGNPAQMQAKVDAAIKQLIKKAGTSDDEESSVSVLAVCMGYLLLPSASQSSNDSDNSERDAISVSSVRYVTAGKKEFSGDRGAFALVHGSVASDTVDGSVFSCSASSTPDLTYTLTRGISTAGSVGTASPPPMSAQKAPSLKSSPRSSLKRRQRTEDIEFYGTLEIAGSSRHRGQEYFKQAIHAFSRTVDSESATIRIKSNEIVIANILRGPECSTILNMEAVTAAIVSESFVSVFSNYQFEGNWRTYIHVFACKSNVDAEKCGAKIVGHIEEAILTFLKNKLSQSNVAISNILQNMPSMPPSAKLRKATEILESLPEDNVVLSPYRSISQFCHDESIEAATLLRLMQAAGTLDKTDQLGFSIPISSGDRYDTVKTEISTMDSHLTKKWNDSIVPLVADLDDVTKIELYDRTFRRSGLPSSARGDIWYTCIGKRHKELSQKSYSTYLKESKLITADEKLQILKDVPRTFGHNNYRFSPENKRNILPQLENILMAKCAKSPGTYWQGMSFIAGFILLQYPDEEKAYWTLVGMLDDVLGLMFTNLGPTVENQLFGEVLTEKLPELSDHISALDVPAEILCTEWFMCAFTTSLPCDSVLQLWDLIILATATQHCGRLRKIAHDDCRDEELSAGVDLMHWFGIELLQQHIESLLQCPDIAELSDELKNRVGSSWDLPGVIRDQDELLSADDGVGSAVALETWSGYISAKRFRLHKELDFSSRRMEKLRTLEAVYGAHADERRLLSYEDFCSICITLAGDSDEVDMGLLQTAKFAFETVVSNRSKRSSIDARRSANSDSDSNCISEDALMDYDQFLIACTHVPKINQMMHMADLSGNSALERLRSLFLQHADENSEITREQLFGLVRSIYSVGGESSGQRSGSPDLRRRSSFSLDDVRSSLESIDSGSTPSQSPFLRARAMSEGAPPSLYDAVSRLERRGSTDQQSDDEDASKHVSRLRRSRTLSDRLFNLIDKDGQGRVTFDEFVRYGRHTSIFNRAMALLGNKPAADSSPRNPVREIERAQKSPRSSASFDGEVQFSQLTTSESISFTVGNPLFCFSVESESFSAKIIESVRTKGKGRQRWNTVGGIDYHIRIRCEFSEEHIIVRTFSDFEKLYRDLFEMAKDDGRLPVRDVSNLLLLPFPKMPLPKTCSDIDMQERSAVLQGFLDAVHLLQSPEANEKVLSFCISSRSGHSKASYRLSSGVLEEVDFDEFV